MNDSLARRIQSGATVECADGYLGRVASVEGDGSRARMLRVDRGPEHDLVAIPTNLIRAVLDDGTVVLSCGLADMGVDPRRVHASAPGHGARLDETRRDAPQAFGGQAVPGEHTIQLREEQLVAHKEMQEVGEVRVRTVVEEVPGRLEVEAIREEVQVEHVPVGEVVSERRAPWQEDDILVVPVYEEQLVVSKRLVLKEHLRIRRVRTAETQLFEDTLLRERALVEDPAGTGLVRERYPDDAEGDRALPSLLDDPSSPRAGRADAEDEDKGFLENLVRKALR